VQAEFARTASDYFLKDRSTLDLTTKVRTYDTNLDTSAIVEAGHIIHELQTIRKVLSQQIAVLQDFKKAQPIRSTDGSRLASLDSVIDGVQIRRRDIEALEKWAANSRDEVRVKDHKA
jgi:hypothetical protein